MIDALITRFDRFLRTVAAPDAVHALRPMPDFAPQVFSNENPQAVDALSEVERQHAAGLMRVNHAGEVAAQALYEGQSLFARDAAWAETLAHAGQEERDHLAWTAERLRTLGAAPSRFNPLWYVGSFLIGAASAALGDAASKAFLKATENQVEAHLSHHLDALPSADLKSRAIVIAMRADEAAHAQTAVDMGAVDPPKVIQSMMKLTSKVMTTTAYRF